MMGIKERRFDPLPRTVSQEDLVPADDLYRRLEERVYLSLVRDLVEYRYGAVDRPSVDPIVFFQLQLILFFEGLSSERQLMKIVADRPSLRW
jgi:transposase